MITALYIGPIQEANYRFLQRAGSLARNYLDLGGMLIFSLFDYVEQRSFDKPRITEDRM
jgi:hypothetical protein